MDTRLIESEKTRRKILLAAKKEFASKGFNGTKVRTIATIADVDKSLIHYHFSKKKNMYLKIFQILINEIFEKYIKKCSNEINSWGITSDIRLCAALYAIVNYEMFLCDDDFDRLIEHEKADGSVIFHQLFNEYLTPQILSFENVIKEGVDSGYFEISDTKMFAVSNISFLRNFVHSKYIVNDINASKMKQIGEREFIYNFILELSFKALRPKNKDLPIPILDLKKKNILNSILEEMLEYTKKMLV